MRRPIALLLFSAALSSACGNGNSGAVTPESPTSAPQASTSAGVPIGTDGVGDPAAPEALQFEAPAVGGGSIDFRQYADTTVAMWFWAPT